MSVVLVTGANRGIGFGIASAIGARLPSSTTVLVGCRDVKAGEQAVAELRRQHEGDNNDNNSGGSTFHALQLDVEDDASIAAAVERVESQFGRLDVLVNNAGSLGSFPDDAEKTLAEMRAASNWRFNNLVTSQAVITHAFLPLLRRTSSWPRVIMVSSSRGSLARAASKKMPPAPVVDYCLAKAALNMLTLHLQLAEDAAVASAAVKQQPHSDGNKQPVTFWAVNPGYCGTAFNGFKGPKSVVQGAEVVIRLLGSARGAVDGGTFWEFEGDGEFRAVPW